MRTANISITAAVGYLALRIVLWVSRFIWSILVEILDRVLGIFIGCISLALFLVAFIALVLWILSL